MAQTVKLLDLFCGAGGAAKGYRLAGFREIIGVDNVPQPNYPFEFILADWEEPLSVLPGLWERDGYMYVVHASPPCQRYSQMTKKWGRSENHPDLVAAVRERIAEVGPAAYVIENVSRAPLIDPVMLCGSMFDLRAGGYGLRRHRLFESNFPLASPGSCRHEGQALPVYGHAGGRSKRDGLRFPGTDAWREGMGISWMTGRELAEAIPPAFTRWVGRQILEALNVG